MKLPYCVVDVFNDVAFRGNPVAVVFDADDLSNEDMASFTKWVNLSESVFVSKPLDARADYRVRIFSSLHELAFAGHPTLGTCHAWAERASASHRGEFVQECGAGLVTIRRFPAGLAFRAPPLIRSGPLDATLIRRVSAGLGLSAVGATISEAQWVDNGAGWLVVAIDDREKLLSLKPDYSQLEGLAVGVLAPWNATPSEAEAQFEIRAFLAGDCVPEDPATGSLVAGVAQWFAREREIPECYSFSQGTALQRNCRIRVTQAPDGIWIGGATRTLLEGVAAFEISAGTAA